MHTQIAIIGGGIIGAITAVVLLKAGFQVRLIDSRQIMQEASWAAGGILSAVSSGSKEQHHVDENAHARYQALQTDIGFSKRQPWLQTGTVFRCFQTSSFYDMALLEKRWEQEVIGSINPIHLRKILRDYLIAANALQEHQRVQQLNIKHGQVQSITLQSSITQDSSSSTVDHVILTCGYQMDALLAANHLPLTGIKPIKGQMLAYKSVDLLLKLGFNAGDVILTPDCYVICRDANTVIVGSTEETNFVNKSTTRAAYHELNNYVQKLLSNALPQVTHHWTGLRPFASAPYNQRWGELENLWVSGGHYRLGICNAPMYAEQLLKQIGTFSS